MTLNKVLIATAVLFLSVPVIPALAHDDDDGYLYGGHDQLHDQLSGAHERAHEEGFESSAEHRAYHRGLRDLHNEYHYDNPAPRYYYYSTPRYWGYRGWGY